MLIVFLKLSTLKRFKARYYSHNRLYLVEGTVTDQNCFVKKLCELKVPITPKYFFR